MGYTTNFNGVLKFTKELTAKQLAKLNSYLGEENKQVTNGYIDLKLNDDFTGLLFNGAEKSYDMEGQVNFIIDEMKKEYPDFSLEGGFLAQGEEIGDIWELIFKNGQAVKKEISLPGTPIKCPHCGRHFNA